jgi:hypothetical protein
MRSEVFPDHPAGAHGEPYMYRKTVKRHTWQEYFLDIKYMFLYCYLQSGFAIKKPAEAQGCFT